jgi:hypothetical protein
MWCSNRVMLGVPRTVDQRGLHGSAGGVGHVHDAPRAVAAFAGEVQLAVFQRKRHAQLRSQAMASGACSTTKRVLRLRRRPRPLRDHADPARPVRRLLPGAVPPAAARTTAWRWRWAPARSRSRCTFVCRARPPRRQPERRAPPADARRVRPARPGRHGRRHRQRHHEPRPPASRSRWRCSPRRAWTIRCTACATTPAPRPSTSRTSCCSPTTSSTSTSSSPGPRAMMADPASEYIAFVEPGQRGHAPRRPAAEPGDELGASRRRACRRCRPTTWCAPTAAASPWSTSASARPTPRPSPTTSPCCARTPGSCWATAPACATASSWATTCWPTAMCARTMCWTKSCRCGCRSRRWPRSRWRWSRPWPR